MAVKIWKFVASRLPFRSPGNIPSTLKVSMMNFTYFFLNFFALHKSTPTCLTQEIFFSKYFYPRPGPWKDFPSSPNNCHSLVDNITT